VLTDNIPAIGLAGFDLVVVASPRIAKQDIESLMQKCVAGGQNCLLVGRDPSRQSPYCSVVRSIPQSSKISSNSDLSLRQKLENKAPVRVVLLNDVGLRFGAGIALRRQAASFLLNGWEVAVVAWDAERDKAPPTVTGVESFDNWHGVYSLRQLRTEISGDHFKTANKAVAQIKALRPDVVVVGNVHGAEWPMAIFPRLQQLGATVIAYMHDCYFVTGRCAQPGPCTMYRFGCDANCPTPHEYPRLEPSKIAGAWRDRAEVFTGRNAVPLIGNSRWTRDIAQQRYCESARTAVVHLGLDEALFAPDSKVAARNLLGIPNDKTIVLMGAVDVENQWKGGLLFQAVYEELSKRDDIAIVLFGRASEKFSAAISLGFVRDERLMPLVYNASDIFVSTGTAESFGQTLLEASACALPVVAFDVGGVSDVIVNGETGLLVKSISAAELVASVEMLIADPALRERLGGKGRTRVQEKFSLARQAEAWVDCLKALC
jgi:glycosyltransferase involved in cell wall biosynthesis